MVVRGKKKTFFRGSVSRNAAKQSREARFPYLNLPKGVALFREEAKTRVLLDIIPYKVTDANHPDRDDEYDMALPGNLWYKRPYWVHRGVGPNNDSIICLATVKQHCPICEHRSKLLKDGAEWNDESVRSLKNTMRNLYLVIPRDNKSYEAKIHVWDVSQFLFQDKLNEEVKENEQFETFPDLEEGHTLQIRFAESQIGTNKFAEVSRIDFQTRKALPESLLEQAPSLDQLIEIPTREEVEAAFFGGVAMKKTTDEEEDILLDEEDEPTKPPTTRRLKKKAVVEDEDEDEDEADDEDEDEEESPPPQKSSRSAPARKQKAPSTKCPHGHAFGKECDEFAECEDCVEWEPCAAVVTEK